MNTTFEAKIHKDREHIIGFCRQFERIHLCGAGDAAKKMLRYFEIEEIKIIDLVVTDCKDVGKNVEGYNVVGFDSIEFDENDGFIICVGIKTSHMIWNTLLSRGVKKENILIQEIFYQSLSGVPNNGMLLEKKELGIKSIVDDHEGYFSDYKKLDSLGITYATDKSSLEHDYCKKYEFFLDKYKTKKFSLVELGVLKGASIRMWGSYFHNARVYGIDFDPDCLQYSGDNREVLIRNLEDKVTFKEIIELNPSIIVDDASHKWMDQLNAFYNLFPALPSGGVYILEDIHTSFELFKHTDYQNACVSTYEFMSAVTSVVTGQTGLSDKSPEYLFQFKNEIEELAKLTEMISFIDSSCIVIRR